MKAEKVIGIAACAFACVTSSAFANTTNGWFGVTVTSDTVNTSNIATNGVGVAQDGKLVLEDVDSSAPLTFTPSVASDRNDGVFVIQAAAELTPNSASDLASAVTEGAKAGFAVGVDNDSTNFYGYANGAWTKLTGASVPALGANTNFKLVMNYRDNKIQFFVDDTLLTSNSTEVTEFVLASGSAPVGIDAYGTGSITSVTGEYEVAVAAYEVEENVYKKYGSIAEAVTAAKKDGKDATSVQAVTDSGVLLPANETASNGLNLVLCEAMGLPTDKDTDEATIKLESATKSHADKITLAWKKPQSADNGVTIKFQVKKNGVDEGKACDWDDIQIPMESGTYTIEPSIE